MSLSENICPVCTTRNKLDVTVCENCGAALDSSFVDLGYKTTNIQALTPEMIRDWSLKEAKETVVPDRGIAFYVNGHSNPAYIDSEEEFVLGRTAGSASEKLLDLAPFGGYSLGISKQHVVIRRTGDSYHVLDLGSFNGTWLNEERLVPHKPYPLPSGSQLRLGRMRILVLYRPSAQTE